MLKAHMDAVELSLLHTSQIPANAGHTLHRGTPRENLILNFLQTHLSANVAIGTGEVFDAAAKPREQRNQFDIVIYRRNYPKLDFGGVNGFFVESVVATIEVKSLLTEDELLKATRAAVNLKKLTPHYYRGAALGWFPPKPLSFVVAYAGPAKIATVVEWDRRSRKALGLSDEHWTQETRLTTAGFALDGISVLGLGGHFLTNSPVYPNELDARIRRFSLEGKGSALMHFFLTLQRACMAVESAELNTAAYLKEHPITGTFWAVGSPSDGACAQPTRLDERQSLIAPSTPQSDWGSEIVKNFRRNK